MTKKYHTTIYSSCVAGERMLQTTEQRWFLASAAHVCVFMRMTSVSDNTVCGLLTGRQNDTVSWGFVRYRPSIAVGDASLHRTVQPPHQSVRVEPAAWRRDRGRECLCCPVSLLRAMGCRVSRDTAPPVPAIAGPCAVESIASYRTTRVGPFLVY